MGLGWQGREGTKRKDVHRLYRFYKNRVTVTLSGAKGTIMNIQDPPTEEVAFLKTASSH